MLSIDEALRELISPHPDRIRRMDKLVSRFMGNEGLIRNQIQVTVPQRTITLAEANYRRVELDVLQSWYDGIVTVRNPETNSTYNAEFEFADERMAEAGTAWDQVGVNAYKEFIAWLMDAIDMVGPIRGAVVRIAVRQLILESAPTVGNNVAMSLSQLEDRIQQDTASAFRFFLMENTIDEFTDGGLATQRVKKWRNAAKIAAIPSDGRIGNTAFAPVTRAVRLSNAIPQAQIDVRGCAVFPEEQNNGRELDVECQLNAFPVPNENRVAVFDTGIPAG